jgi:hypothetical protein
MLSLALIAAAAAVPNALAHAQGVQHDDAAAFWRRQASSAAPSGSSASPAAGSSSSIAGGGTSLASTTAGAATTTPATVSFSLASTNPTAIPLSQITAFATGQPTTTYSIPAAGATPTYMSGAPGLPDRAYRKNRAPVFNCLMFKSDTTVFRHFYPVGTIHPTNYPTLDVIPRTDSPEVQQWIKDVAASGVTIPNITATVEGGCAANPQAVADTSRCWWTCGGCTRDSDITTCPDKLTWGLTYDDGPAPYTPNLLQYLDEHSLKATFFVVGSRVISYPALLQDEYLKGHQISVHTWSHHSLTQMTNEQIIAELGWSKKVIKDVLGVTPNTWRPPFGDIE